MLSIGGGGNLGVHLSEKPHPGLKIETRELRPIQTELNQEQQPVLRFFIQNSRLRVRFLQTDPMGYKDSLNLYQAFNQNPVNFVDPMGEDYYSSEYYKRLTRNAKPITWEEIDTALTGISEATRWGVQRVVNLGLGLIQSAGHLINSIFIPGYGNRDHYFYSLDLEDPSGYSVSVDSRPSYQKVAGYSGGDMAKLPEHLYEAGKSGIKMLDPNLSSSERKQHAKRFVEGVTDAGVLAWGGFKYYKNYKAISPNYVEEAPVKKCGRSLPTTFWPKNRGFLKTPNRKFLMPGEVISRYGFEGGKFVSPEGVPFEMRGLPPEYSATKPYHVYEVVKPFEIKYGPAAPAFNQIGLGMQYELPVSIEKLLERGVIKRVR